MAKKYLIINIGSSSKRYSFFSDGEEKLRAHFSQNGENFSVFFKSSKQKEEITFSDFTFSTKYFLNKIKDLNLIEKKIDIEKIGIRIVAPGTYFTKHRNIDNLFFKKLEEVESIVPLHIIPVLREIKSLKEALPNVILIGISDSAFHKTLPPEARHYGLPLKTIQNLDLYRFGYHGISVQSSIVQASNILGYIPQKTIICHLGSGSSVTALKNGKSFDTSMGFTPLEGLVMSTRSGNIDAGAVVYLADKLNLSFEKIENYLNTRSGLLGLSKKTGDISSLRKLAQDGDKDSLFALNIFIYNIKKYIGAYSAVLGGLDTLIFTASAGEGAPDFRQQICSTLNYLGVNLDEVKNEEIINETRLINSSDSKVKVLVVKNDEVAQMAQLMGKIDN